MGHNDVGTYLGHDVLIWCSSNDPVIDANNVMLIDMVTGEKRVLLTLDFAYAFHVSCSRTHPWGTISAFDPKNVKPTMVLRVFFDGSAPLVQTANTGGIYRTYESAPKGTTDDEDVTVIAVDDGVTVNACWVGDGPGKAELQPQVKTALEGIGFVEAAFSPADEGEEWVWLFHYIKGAMQPPVLFSRKSSS
jgi:hypothetical protein